MSSSIRRSRSRLHPAAVVALGLGGVLVAGAIAVLVWFLTTQQNTDPNAEATQRLVQWQGVFEKYRAAHNGLPDLPDGGYCLGTGFPVGAGGTANCRDYDAVSYYTETASVPLMQELSTTGALPQGVSIPVRGTVGPYALFEQGQIQLLTAENGECVAPAADVWNDGEGLHICQITLTR